MQRRELIQKVLSAAAAAGLLGPLSLTSASAHECTSAGLHDSAESLRRGLKRMAMLDSSEQGIPMLLTLENLAADSTVTKFLPDAFNAEVVEKLGHYVDLLLQHKPEPEESDVAALIVLIAAADLLPADAGVCP
jgi:hypothetical protein